MWVGRSTGYIQEPTVVVKELYMLIIIVKKEKKEEKREKRNKEKKMTVGESERE